MQSSRTRRGDTKVRILDAAIDMFASRGYRESSMRDIAAEVGIRAASLYSHFENKEEILRTILDDYRNEIAKLRVTDSDLEAIVEKHSAESILAEGFKAIHRGMSPPRTERIQRILLNEMFNHPLVAEFGLDCLKKNNVQELSRVFAVMQRRTKMRRLDPEFVSVLYNALVNDYFQELAARRACRRSTEGLKRRAVRNFRLLASLLSGDSSRPESNASLR